jgi:hypothetical protein
MEMTNNDCVIMHNALNKIKQPSFSEIKDMEKRDDYIFHVRFVQALSLNKRLLTQLIESIQEAIKPSEEFKAYSEARQEIYLKYAKRNEDGNAIEVTETINGQQARSYIIPHLTDKGSQVNKDLNKLEKENKEIIEMQKAKDEEDKLFMKAKADFTPKKVRFSMIPRGLDREIMDGVLFMIEDDEEETPEPEKKPSKKEK